MSDAESSGEQVFLEALSGGGGITIGTQFSVLAGDEGKWLVASFSIDSAEPGFFLLAILETESASAKGCVEGSVNLQNIIIGSPTVRSKTVSLEWPEFREWHEPFSQQ